MMKVVWYIDEQGKSPMESFLKKVKSVRDSGRILKEIDKLEYGNMGDCKPLRGGIQEKRLHFTPEPYRLYFGYDGDKIIVLLSGSNKGDQEKEIKSAIEYWKDYKRLKALNNREIALKGGD